MKRASKRQEPTSRVVRVDAEVWALIERNVHSVSDTPNKVLRRLLDIDKASATMPRGGIKP